MLARIAAGLAVAIAALLPLAESACADMISEEILSGGAPRGRPSGSMGTFFGGGYYSSSPVSYTHLTLPTILRV